MKPLIHFAHANGVPSQVYQKLFDLLSDEYEVIYTSPLGPDKRYPIDEGWQSLTQQVIDSIVRQANGRPVIGIGHSLGSVLTMQAAYARPELFNQVILLDPPLLVGKTALALQLTKWFAPQKLDQFSPAGLSKKRRDHWESREQAAASLRPKAFYKDFDEACFQAYIQHALVEDPIRGGVTLTIPKMDEVNIFRTNPTKYWQPIAQPSLPMHLVVGKTSIFNEKGFPQLIQDKLGIPYSIVAGGHMFPLEHPLEVVEFIKRII